MVRSVGLCPARHVHANATAACKTQAPAIHVQTRLCPVQSQRVGWISRGPATPACTRQRVVQHVDQHPKPLVASWWQCRTRSSRTGLAWHNVCCSLPAAPVGPSAEWVWTHQEAADSIATGCHFTDASISVGWVIHAGPSQRTYANGCLSEFDPAFFSIAQECVTCRYM